LPLDLFAQRADIHPMDRLRIFTTGGTIDKVYFDARSTYQVGPPHIIEMLKGLPVTLDYLVTSLMKKDSLEITDEDRTQIVRNVAGAAESRVVITHGTDTMTMTAQALLDDRTAIEGSTVVLTGALQPAAFRDSDAYFNVGAAIAAAQTLPPGVYIAMNGRIFHGGRVRKDPATNCFVDS
jgi:L-asparaginase